MNCLIKSDGIYYSKVPNGYLLLLLFFFFFLGIGYLLLYSRERYYTKGSPSTELYFAFYKLKTKEISSAKQELELS